MSHSLEIGNIPTRQPKVREIYKPIFPAPSVCEYYCRVAGWQLHTLGAERTLDRDKILTFQPKVREIFVRLTRYQVSLFLSFVNTAAPLVATRNALSY